MYGGSVDGFVSNGNFGVSNMYHVAIKKRHLSPSVACFSPGRNCSFVKKRGDFSVVCFDVPNGILVTMRNGKTAVQGNSKQLHHICRLHEFISRITGGESFAASLKSKQRERFVQLKRSVLPVDEAVALAQSTDQLTHDLKAAWVEQHTPAINEEMPLLLDKVCYEVLKTRFTRELLAAQFKL